MWWCVGGGECGVVSWERLPLLGSGERFAQLPSKSTEKGGGVEQRVSNAAKGRPRSPPHSQNITDSKHLNTKSTKTHVIRYTQRGNWQRKAQIPFVFLLYLFSPFPNIYIKVYIFVLLYIFPFSYFPKNFCTEERKRPWEIDRQRREESRPEKRYMTTNLPLDGLPTVMYQFAHRAKKVNFQH